MILLDYGHHFTRLVAASIGLVALEAAVAALAPEFRRPPAGVELEFAAYGALHALTLVSSLPTRIARSRQALFVATAAALSVATAALGLALLHRTAQLGGAVPVLAGAAALGALAYAGAIGGVLGGRCAGRAAALAPPLCAAAAAAVYPLARQVPSGALGLVFALPWWFAFSGALWFAGARRPSATK